MLWHYTDVNGEYGYRFPVSYTHLDVYKRQAPEDMGKVIGKQGRIAKAIRSVVKAAAIKENKKISVDIV